jgi:exosome complex component RRP4
MNPREDRKFEREDIRQENGEPGEHVEEENMEEEFEEKKERKVVVPGEVIATGMNFLPGENAKREGKDVIATRFGLEDVSGRIARVIPLSGVYLPRRGNVVVGKVTEITFNGWLIDINCPYPAFLPLTECRGFISKKDDLSAVYNFDDIIVAKVTSVKAKGVDLTMRDRGLMKLYDGIILQVNSNKVPRIIGKKGSMVNMIKDMAKCDITVGQNGVVWLRAENLKNELIAKEAITLIAKKSLSGGLTEQIKEFLEKKLK